MAIDQKVESVYKMSKFDGQPGNASDVAEFFAKEKDAKIDAIYRTLVLGMPQAPIIDERDSGKETAAQYLSEQKAAKEKPVYRSFSVVRADTYAKGVAKLKAKGQVPFSHEQNVEARVLDYEAKGDESELFNTWLDSVTGFAYKAYSAKFKVSPVCDALVAIKPKFDNNFLPVDYESLKAKDGWVELDSSDPNVKYNQDLTRAEAKVHPAHIAAMGGNSKLWAKYVDLWFDKTKRTKGMGVYVMQNTSEDQLRSVVLHYDYYYFVVYGSYNLYDIARFVSGAQSK